MKDTFANAQENVSNEQLKNVTGGARVNPMPHAAEDLIPPPPGESIPQSMPLSAPDACGYDFGGRPVVT